QCQCQKTIPLQIHASLATMVARCLRRAFPGKVDTGFPIGNATNIESRALSDHDPRNFLINLKRSSVGGRLSAHGSLLYSGPSCRGPRMPTGDQDEGRPQERPKEIP